jgi:hypothetical protein
MVVSRGSNAPTNYEGLMYESERLDMRFSRLVTVFTSSEQELLVQQMG